MTIKKLKMSAVVASAILAGAATIASAATTGTASVDSNASTLASELLIGQDYNGTSVDLNSTFAPALNAGVQDGKIMIEFAGGRLQSVDSNITVYNLDTNKTVGINPTLSGTDNQKLIFDVNDTINDADVLRLTEDDTNGTVARTTDAVVKLDVLQGKTAVTMNYSLLDNVDALLSTADAGIVIETKQEWEVSVAQKFDAQIDAAVGFKYFTDSVRVDTSDVHIKHNPVDVGTGSVTWNVKTYMDNNVTAFGTLASAATGQAGVSTGATATPAVNSIVLASDANGYVVDKNITTNKAASDDYNLTFTADTTNEILETVFTTSVSALSAAENPSFEQDYLSKKDLGAWTIYGYKAQIPNVASTSDVDVTMKFTNRSTLDTNIYFTLIDPAGNTVTLDSVNNPTLAALPANATGTYKASDLVALIPAGTTFDTTGSFSVEVSIPTTPSKVYGMASFKNLTLGQFKDLPVYNTSTLAY